MAEQSGFFDAHLIGGEYDRTYLASSFARYFSSFIGNGVFAGKSDELMVYQTAPTGMGVKVLPGQAWINGYWYENDNEFSLPIDVADGVLNRIDLVVLRWGTTERSINLAVKRGTPAVNALPPVIQRDSDYYELKLAEIQVSAGTAKITQANIVDTRTDTNVCGWVTGVIKQADTSDLFAQWQTAYEAEYNKVQAYYEEQKAAWERFFASIAEDSVFPVPSLDDVGKIPVINESANGYELKDILSLKGLNLGGSLNMNGNKLVGLPLPTTASEPATKEFVENFTYIIPPFTNIGSYEGDLNSLDIQLNSVAWVEKDTCTNSPTSTAFYLETWGSQANIRFQRCISTEGTTCQRMYFNGAWTEWDWFNPWQANGSEARTAERWNGHVVYTRNVACGALTSGRKLIELPELANCVVLDAFGYVNQGGNNFTMIPSIYSQDLASSTSVSLLVNTTNTNGAIQIWGGSGLVGKTAFVQLKYFKL